MKIVLIQDHQNTGALQALAQHYGFPVLDRDEFHSLAHHVEKNTAGLPTMLFLDDMHLNDWSRLAAWKYDDRFTAYVSLVK